MPLALAIGGYMDVYEHLYILGTCESDHCFSQIRHERRVDKGDRVGDTICWENVMEISHGHWDNYTSEWAQH